MLEYLNNFLRSGCFHAKTTGPINGRERCLTCAWFRFVGPERTSRWHRPGTERVVGRIQNER